MAVDNAKSPKKSTPFFLPAAMPETKYRLSDAMFIHSIHIKC